MSENPCTCVSCPDCAGNGSVWFDFSGRFIGQGRCDDLDQLEPCENCEGGIVEVCDNCRDHEEIV